MNNAQFFVSQEARKYESCCSSAIQQVRRAATMWEVHRAAQVPVPSILRGMHFGQVGAPRDLAQAAERRMQLLLDEQLKKAAELPDLEARRAYIGSLRAHHWGALRGYFARLYVRADREGRRLLAKP